MRRFFWLAMAGLLAAGCGSSGGSNDAGADSGPTFDASPPDAAIEASLDTLCAVDGLYVDLYTKILDCSPLLALLLFDGEQPTVANISGACYAGLTDHIGDGTVVLGDPAAFAACAAYLDGLTCADIVAGADLSPCDGVLVGTVALGGDCNTDDQCVGDAYCAAGDPCGTCTAQAADGDPCTRGAECLGGTCLDAGECGKPGGPGEACATGDQCQSGLICDATTHCTAPVIGDDCTPSAPATCGFPESNLYCNPTSNQCALRADVDQACNSVWACDVVNWEWCDSGGTGTCQPPTPRADGESCGLLTGERCGPGLRCTDLGGGTCFDPRSETQACDPGNDPTTACEAFLTCTGGTCEYPTPTGSCPPP